MTHNHTHYAGNIVTKKNEASWELEVSGEISAAGITQYRAEALKELKKTAHIDGFRKGYAPENLILERVGEKAILEEAAELAIKHELPEILANAKENIVDTPQVSMEPVEAGKAVKFTAHAPLAPEVKLPDYKKIAKTINATKESQSVTDKEHTDALGHLKRERARIDAIESGKSHQETAELLKNMKEDELPAIDDEFAVSLGYDSASAFEDAVRSNILSEKELRDSEKRRAKTLEELNEKSTVHYPTILTAYELQDMQSRLEDDIARTGSTLEKFLADSKKTLEELFTEWKPAAEKRARIRLILTHIAQAEKVEPSAEELSEQIAEAKKHYKDASEESLRAHISHAMRNEAVIRWLEEQK